MKNQILLCAAAFIAACTFSTQVNAQLKVANSGNVGISVANNIEPLSALSVGGSGFNNAMISIKNNAQSYGESGFANLRSDLTLASAEGWNYAVSGNTAISEEGNRFVGITGNASYNGTLSCGRSYGVLGLARGATSGWNFGVLGMLSNNGSEYGAGVFGAANNTGECYVAGRYAGFFNGQTKVNGNLYATSFVTTSDARLKASITDIKSDALQKVQTLHPIQFNWREVEDKHTSDTASVKTMYFSEDIDYNRLHYGFLAQEVQKLFPELVHEDGDGYLSVNYVELIPLLIQAVQELSAELEEIKNATKAKKVVFDDKHSDAEAIEAVLYQNNPNPFTVDTQIEYQLPQTTKSATLYIYNMNGLQVAKYPISTFGNGYIVVSAGALDAGMYLYSLVADGQVIDTKRMILTK